MKLSFRWFGPEDPVPLAYIAQIPAMHSVVTAVYDDEFLGTTVVINHPDGHVSQYSNLAVMPSVSAGDSVEAGQTIGAVGETALLEIADEPHLHFAVYANGDTIDPAEFIR